MITIKKIVLLITFAIGSFFSLSQSALAECNIFDFPLIKNNEIFFFNCYSGQIQKVNANGQLVSVPEDLSLGSFIHTFIWSPDGSKALILSENILAAKQVLEFYSPERELNSLNWWIYDINTKTSSLLDKKIVSIGWASNDMVVYNWDNISLSTAKLNNLALDNYTQLADIKNDTNTLVQIVSPVSMGNFVFFPMEKGFYAISLGKNEAKYYALSGQIQKLLSNPFERQFFIFKSGNYLFKFNTADESLTAADSAFSATDMAFITNNSLATVEADGKIYTYDLTSKTKTQIPLNTAGNVSWVFSLERNGEFLYTVGNSIYQKNINNATSVLLLGQNPTNAKQSEKPSLSGKSPNKYLPILLIIGAILILVIVIATFFYLKRNRN